MPDIRIDVPIGGPIMNDAERHTKRMAELAVKLQTKLRLRRAPFARLIDRAKRRLPRRVAQNAARLAEAQEFNAHPKLSRTLDYAALSQSADVVEAHLNSIDLADQRKGRLLGLLGTLAFNLICIASLLVIVLMWRGFL